MYRVAVSSISTSDERFRISSSDVTGEANQCCSCLLQRWYCWQRPHTHFKSVGWLSAEEGCSFFSASGSSSEICPYSDVSGASQGTLGETAENLQQNPHYLFRILPVDFACRKFLQQIHTVCFPPKGAVGLLCGPSPCKCYSPWKLKSCCLHLLEQCSPTWGSQTVREIQLPTCPDNLHLSDM